MGIGCVINSFEVCIYIYMYKKKLFYIKLVIFLCIYIQHFLKFESLGLALGLFEVFAFDSFGTSSCASMSSRLIRTCMLLGYDGLHAGM